MLINANILYAIGLLLIMFIGETCIIVAF